MVDKLKRMKKLLFIPAWGVIIIMFFLRNKSIKDESFKLKHLLIVQFIIGLTSILGMLTVISIAGLLYRMGIIFIGEDIFILVTLLVADIIVGYLMDVPCLIYINYIIKINQ